MLTKEYQRQLNEGPVINDRKAMQCFLTMAIDNLISLQKLRLSNHRQIDRHFRDAGSTPRFWREYATIVVDSGRQTGMSTWIAQNATNEDLVIVMNNTMKEIFLQKSDIDESRVLSFRTIRHRATNCTDNQPVIKFKRCFIDEGGYLSSNDVEQIYKNLASFYPAEDAMECRFFRL